MHPTLFQGDHCPYCGSTVVYAERNCSTQEYLYHCMACGSFESFEFRVNKDGLIQKTVWIPLEEIALTVRIVDPAAAAQPVVWSAQMPADADTEFIYYFWNHRLEEMRQNYPQFIGPDLEALARQHGNQPICCIERRLGKSQGRDEQIYMRLNHLGNSFEIQAKNGTPALLFRRGRYKYHRSIGCGIICIEYTNGDPIYWRTFSAGTTANRAERLWRAHTTENTDFRHSYMTLMENGKLRVLRGSVLPEAL